MPVSLAARTALALVLIGGVVKAQGAHDQTTTQTQLIDRVASRVERAKAITPETRDALSGLVDRSLAAPSANSHDAEQQRQLAIIRLELALRSVRTDGSMGGSTVAYQIP